MVRKKGADHHYAQVTFDLVQLRGTNHNIVYRILDSRR